MSLQSETGQTAIMRLPEVSFQTSSFGEKLISSLLLLSLPVFFFFFVLSFLFSLLSPRSLFSFSSLPTPSLLLLKPIYFSSRLLLCPLSPFPPFSLSFLSFPYFICLCLCLLLSVLSTKSTLKALISFYKGTNPVREDSIFIA